VLGAVRWHIPEQKFKQKYFQKYHHREILDPINYKKKVVLWRPKLQKQI
jgi:hypothetical protein